MARLKKIQKKMPVDPVHRKKTEEPNEIIATKLSLDSNQIESLDDPMLEDTQDWAAEDRLKAIEDYQYGIVKSAVEIRGKRTKVEEHYLVKCPMCSGIFYETTDDFNPDVTAHPGMIRMLKQYRDWGWDKVVDTTSGIGSMECPQCGGIMAPSGKLTLLPYKKVNENG